MVWIDLGGKFMLEDSKVRFFDICSQFNSKKCMYISKVCDAFINKKGQVMVLAPEQQGLGWIIITMEFLIDTIDRVPLCTISWKFWTLAKSWPWPNARVGNLKWDFRGGPYLARNFRY
jgi:hypothetical protein